MLHCEQQIPTDISIKGNLPSRQEKESAGHRLRPPAHCVQSEMMVSAATTTEWLHTQVQTAKASNLVFGE